MAIAYIGYIIYKKSIFVAGYARQIKELPRDVIDICHLYLDEWYNNHSCIFPMITITGNKVTNFSKQSESVSFRKMVSENVHIWKIRINQITNSWCIFGIWKTKYGQPKIDDLAIKNDKTYGYVFIHADRYGVPIYNGDILEMIVDLERLTVSYKVNDVNQGTAFKDIEKTTYRACITLGCLKDSFTLIHDRK